MSFSSSSVNGSSSLNSVVSKSESRPAPIQTYEQESCVSCIAFFPDEQRLVTGSADGGVGVWDRETGPQIGDHLEGHTEVVSAVAVSPDGRTIASGADNTVKLWDAKTKELLRTLRHENRVRTVHISPDSKRVVSGSYEVRVWDVETGELAFNPIKCHLHGWVDCVRYSPSGDRIASVTGGIQIWNADTGEHILSIDGEVFSESLAWSLSTKEQIIGGGRTGNITIWDTSSGQKIRTWKAHDFWITSLSLSRNGSHLATCSTNEKTVFVFDITTGQQIAAYEHSGNVWGIDYSPSGRFIATVCVDKKAYLWAAPADPQAMSPALSPLDASAVFLVFSVCNALTSILQLPAIAPESEHSQQGYDYRDFLDACPSIYPSPLSHTDSLLSSYPPPRVLLTVPQDATIGQLNRRRRSGAGDEGNSAGPSWWKRTQLRAVNQTMRRLPFTATAPLIVGLPQPPVDDDQYNPRTAATDSFGRAQRPLENNEHGSGSRNRSGRLQRFQVAAGRDKAFWGIIHDIEYTTTNTILFMICYCRRPPVDDAEEDEPALNSEGLRPDPSHAAPNTPGGLRVIGTFNRLLSFLHLRNPQNANIIDPQSPMTTIVVPSTSVPPPSSSPNNVVSIGPRDPAAAQLAPPAVAVFPPVGTSTAPPPSSDRAPTSSPAYPITQPSSSSAPAMNSLPGFSSALPVQAAQRPSSSQDGDDITVYALSSDEVENLREYRRLKDSSAGPSKTSGDTVPASLNGSLPSPPLAEATSSLLSHLQDATLMLQPPSIFPPQSSPSSIPLINTLNPSFVSPAEHLMLPYSNLPKGSQIVIEADSMPALEFENPWASEDH
ncbi:hypothetical protein HYDPIDRAFT_28185 [Hydnomerulius pinastri MD-312]|uniref:WD40 repeat-like protein n=1 Tax=Hydnomerulius pinastri MD-312 TaxID=994086 RepID=A0A0C9WFG8_9AGAM|nr:hypothetical protein HYDPIDRAFT_28185 [Hydnomerulius pinastri MD-312]